MDVREFNYLFEYGWNESGGLIQQAIAAKMLGITRGRVNQIWEERKFKKYIFGLVSINDVRKLKKEKWDKLSQSAKEILEERQAQWIKEYEEYCDKLPIIEDTSEPDNKENIENEIEEYEDYLNKNI